MFVIEILTDVLSAEKETVQFVKTEEILYKEYSYMNKEGKDALLEKSGWWPDVELYGGFPRKGSDGKGRFLLIRLRDKREADRVLFIENAHVYIYAEAKIIKRFALFC